MGFLLALTGWGAFCYILQVRYGLGATGMNQPVSWGFYITNFVFFIGISHAGTLISAILRMTRAEWRRPVTRMAEVITVVVLFIGAANVFFDLGRPDRIYSPLLYGRYQSPLLWDATSISAYLTASSVFLYIPLIPDIAILRDRFAHRKWLHRFYQVLSFGWNGNPRQQKVLNGGIAIMSVIVIPIAVSVHTVISYIFSMTLQPMWHSTIFGPYFVCGAIFSGIAALIVFMVILRKIYHLETYLKPIHFNYLGVLLLVMSLLWFYFTFSEYLTGFFGHEPSEMRVFWAKFSGPYAPYFWTMVLCNFIIPVIILSFRRTKTITGIFIASVAVLIGMWLERFTIIVPTLANPRLPFPSGIYFPTWIEWGVTLGCFSFFVFLYLLFSRFFPIISIWEIREGKEMALKEVEERIRGYLPETAS
ncbi:MAG: NrfD/PsrC family molybdoenzyme membrane anchor subunit [Thermodesulfobacteriota bacterium]